MPMYIMILGGDFITDQLCTFYSFPTMSDDTCTTDDLITFENNLQIFVVFMWSTVALTFVNIIILRIIGAAAATGSSGKLKYLGIFEICFGLLKVACSILLLTAFFPSCPSRCSGWCDSSYIVYYPILSIIIGLSWIARGYVFVKAFQRAMLQSSNPINVVVGGVPVPATAAYSYHTMQTPTNNNNNYVNPDLKV